MKLFAKKKNILFRRDKYKISAAKYFNKTGTYYKKVLI